MPILVNGELLPEQLIHAEFERLLFHPDFVGITNELDKRQRVRQAAETGAVNRLLVTQEALNDRRPVDEAAVQAEIAEFRAQNDEHAAVDERVLRFTIEARLRVHGEIEKMLGRRSHFFTSASEMLHALPIG